MRKLFLVIYVYQGIPMAFWFLDGVLCFLFFYVCVPFFERARVRIAQWLSGSRTFMEIPFMLY